MPPSFARPMAHPLARARPAVTMNDIVIAAGRMELAVAMTACPLLRFLHTTQPCPLHPRSWHTVAGLFAEWQYLQPLPGRAPLASLTPGLDPFPSPTSPSGGSSVTRSTRSSHSVSSTLIEGVYAHYGLHRGHTHMLGSGHGSVAHLWPSSSTQHVGWIGKLLGLRDDFMNDARNYLVLPKDLHDAFDEGVVVFLPRRVPLTSSLIGVDVGERRQLTVRVLSERLTHFRNPTTRAAIAAYHDKTLSWPNSNARPFTRLLAWHAWCVRGSQLLQHDVDYDFMAALSLPQSIAGQAALETAVDRFSAAGLLPRRRRAHSMIPFGTSGFFHYPMMPLRGARPHQGCVWPLQAWQQRRKCISGRGSIA